MAPAYWQRNNTDYGARAVAHLRELYGAYRRAEADAADPEHRWATLLKYYQWAIRALFSDPAFGIGMPGNGRGVLVYATVGMGKTRIAASVTLASSRPAVVFLPRSLRGNYADTLVWLLRQLHAAEGEAAVERHIADAMARVSFVSSDAYNAADQMARAGTKGLLDMGAAVPRGDIASAIGGLDGKLLVVDEAHNFFRAVINSAGGSTNARRVYEMVMTARDLRIVFLTGTPASKNPFELVPCFNMLAGFDLLPTQYDVFYDMYVDTAKNKVKNAGRLANRISGLVSHVTHRRPVVPAQPGAAAAEEEAAAAARQPQPRDDGWFPELFPTVVERVPMGAEQYRDYLRAREKERVEGKGRGGPGGPREGPVVASALALPGSERKSASTYYVRSRTLGNYAPPPGSPPLVPGQAEAYVAALPDEAFTAETGPKLARIAERARAAPGPVLVYSQFRELGGIAAMARFLRRAGFEPWAMGSGEGAAASRAKGGGQVPGTPVDCSGAQFRTTTGPPGRTVVFFNGFGDTLHTWDTVSKASTSSLHDLVAGHASTVLFDLPGIGESSGGIPADFDAEARYAHCVLERAGACPPYVLVGHSVGACLALVFYKLYPREVAGAVLIDPPSVTAWTDGTPPPRFEGPNANILAEYHANHLRSHKQIPGNLQKLRVHTHINVRAQDGKLNLKDSKRLSEYNIVSKRGSVYAHTDVSHYIHRTDPFPILESILQFISGTGGGASDQCPVFSAAGGRHRINYEGGGAHTFSDGVHVYDVVRLWALTKELPVAERSVSELDWMMDDPCWSMPDEPPLTPRMVLADMDRYPAHARRIRAADLTLPLLLRPLEPGGSELVVIDGVHRLARAVLDGRATVPTRLVPDTLLAAAEVPDESRALEFRGGGGPLRYAVISGAIDPRDRLRVQEAFNSDANKRGDVIKALLVTKSGAEGLDLKWVRQVHQVEAYWDKAREEQVNGRANRMGCLDGLPREERDVQPYLYLAVANPEVYAKLDPADREDQTTDEMFHSRAERMWALNDSFRDLCAHSSLECALYGYGDCFHCVPTNSPLYHADPALDLRLPNPCQQCVEAEVTVTPVELDGVTYYWSPDPRSPHGRAFYELREDLGGYAPIDPSDPRIVALVEAADNTGASG